MEHLPDDVLVTLMEYLDVKDLLACRLVCKRVGGLALHRDVWRRRQAVDLRCVCPVLRVAPCVASLHVRLPHRCRCGLANITTRCAVTALSLSLYKDYDAMRAAAVICRQEALGRLRSVQVAFGSGEPTDVACVLGTLATTADLEELQVTGLRVYLACKGAPAAVLGSVSTPSLRFFRCELFPQTEHFVNFILAGHAATLQKVDLGHWSCTGSPDSSGLLGAMPNLRQLKCGSNPGLEAVAACESLQHLDLLVRICDRTAIAGTAQLLRRAKNLREVRLEFPPVLTSDEDAGVDFLLALASPGRSCLEKLTVYNHFDVMRAVYIPVQTLVRVLPSLSVLVHLKVVADVSPDELLLAITPDVAPALQEVDVRLPQGTCAHGWIHGDTVKAVLSANPSLHIEMQTMRTSCKDSCCACTLGCHSVLRERDISAPKDRFFYLFSHDPTVRCSRRHLNDYWIHVSV